MCPVLSPPPSLISRNQSTASPSPSSSPSQSPAASRFLFAEPYLSSDISRYVWDGIVQHAHINPYRYVPGDPVLAFLRAPNQDIFDNINRRDTPTPSTLRRAGALLLNHLDLAHRHLHEDRDGSLRRRHDVRPHHAFALPRHSPRADPSLTPGAPSSSGRSPVLATSTRRHGLHCPRAPRPLSQAADSHWPLPGHRDPAQVSTRWYSFRL